MPRCPQEISDGLRWSSRLDTLKGEEDQIAALGAQAAKVQQDAARLNGEIKVLEGTLGSCEEDKMTKDSQIRTLKDEIAHQEELIANLGTIARSGSKVAVVIDLSFLLFVLFFHFSFPLHVIYLICLSYMKVQFLKCTVVYLICSMS